MIENGAIEDLMREDELGMVIRAHIHVEAQLIRLLEALVPYPESLDKMNLDYSQRVNLSIAMGLKPEQAPPLRALGSIRNRFAHRLDSSLNRSDVDNLYNAFSSDDKIIVQQGFDRTNKQMSQDNKVKFKMLEPRDQFILMAVTLISMLEVAVSEVVARENGA